MSFNASLCVAVIILAALDEVLDAADGTCQSDELLGSSDGNIVRNGRFFGYF